MQTSGDYHAKNVSPVLEEQPSQAGRGTRSQLRLKLNYGESISTKPCCLSRSSFKICFLSDFPYILPHIFYPSRSLPSPARLTDSVLHQHPPWIFMSSWKLHPFPRCSCWGLFMHPLWLQLQHLSSNWEGSLRSSGSPACLLTVGAIQNAKLSAFFFHSGDITSSTALGVFHSNSWKFLIFNTICFFLFILLSIGANFARQFLMNP